MLLNSANTLWCSQTLFLINTFLPLIYFFICFLIAGYILIHNFWNYLFQFSLLFYLYILHNIGHHWLSFFLFLTGSMVILCKNDKFIRWNSKRWRNISLFFCSLMLFDYMRNVSHVVKYSSKKLYIFKFRDALIFWVRKISIIFQTDERDFWKFIYNEKIF